MDSARHFNTARTLAAICKMPGSANTKARKLSLGIFLFLLFAASAALLLLATQWPSPPMHDNFVLVEAGTFRMGSESGEWDEKPIHAVTISKPFYISRNEVTQKLWQEVMGPNPSFFKGDNLPVENVTWYDALSFCNALSARAKLTPVYSGGSGHIFCDFSANGYRLPTEAEWEYAAGGGNKSGDFTYSGSNSARDVSWFNANSERRTHEIGQRQPNELGLYDMSGNVFEWCWDLYDSYSAAPQNDLQGSLKGSLRVFRGGSWHNNIKAVRVTDRYSHNPSYWNYNLGLRLVRTAE